MIEILLICFLCLFQSYISTYMSKKIKIFNFFHISLFLLILFFYFIFSPTVRLGNIFYGILIGISAFLFLGIPMFLWEAKKQKKITSNPKSKFKKILEYLLVVSPTEEIMFRGIIFSIVLPYGLVFAILFQAFLFSIWHLKFNREFLIKIFIFGIIFELLYIVSGSILTPILFHALLNIGEFTVKPLFIKK